MGNGPLVRIGIRFLNRYEKLGDNESMMKCLSEIISNNSIPR